MIDNTNNIIQQSQQKGKQLTTDTYFYLVSNFQQKIKLED